MTISHDMGVRLERWLARASEMTGEPGDIDGAFDQWIQEREALPAFFNQMENDEKLLRRLSESWAIIRKAIWGKEKISADTIRAISPVSIQKVIEAAIKLDGWKDDTIEALKSEDVEPYRQLTLDFPKKNFVESLKDLYDPEPKVK